MAKLSKNNLRQRRNRRSRTIGGGTIDVQVNLFGEKTETITLPDNSTVKTVFDWVRSFTGIDDEYIAVMTQNNKDHILYKDIKLISHPDLLNLIVQAINKFPPLHVQLQLFDGESLNLLLPNDAKVQTVKNWVTAYTGIDSDRLFIISQNKILKNDTHLNDNKNYLNLKVKLRPSIATPINPPTLEVKVELPNEYGEGVSLSLQDDATVSTVKEWLAAYLGYDYDLIRLKVADKKKLRLLSSNIRLNSNPDFLNLSAGLSSMGGIIFRKDFM
jgi:hypothetical protein